MGGTSSHRAVHSVHGNQLSQQDRIQGTPSHVGLTALQDPYLENSMALQPEPFAANSHTHIMSAQTPMGTFATNLTDKLNRADNVVEPE
jgi:hypothetical protein